MLQFIKKITTNFASLPSDSELIKFEKKLIFVLTTSCSICGIIWGIIYNYFIGPSYVTFLPFVFSVSIGVMLLITHVLKKHLLLVITQIVLIIWIPLLVQWCIGNIHDSSLVFLWGILGPVGSIFFFNKKWTFLILAKYIFIISLTLVFEPKIETRDFEISSLMRVSFYIMNILAPSVLVFFAAFYFSVEQRRQNNINKSLIVEMKAKNKKISESINYAKRIQQAILPPIDTIQNTLNKSFIYYCPKDVVAGDFYWFETVNNKTFFAVADCTGHGIPGAMISIICNNALNRCVKEFQLTDPSDILNTTRDIVIQELGDSKNSLRDGMDIALCILEGNVLTFSGAYRPLWIIRNNQNKIDIIKGDKMPVGHHPRMNFFTKHQITLEKGDSFYLFSDGLTDQFGGPEGKKYNNKQLTSLLLKLQDIPMKKQEKYIEENFIKWKATNPQIDDVCIMGITYQDEILTQLSHNNECKSEELLATY